MKILPPDLECKEVVIRTRSGKVFDGKVFRYPGGVKLSGGSSTVYISLSDIMSIQEVEENHDQ